MKTHQGDTPDVTLSGLVYVVCLNQDSENATTACLKYHRTLITQKMWNWQTDIFLKTVSWLVSGAVLFI